jgi:hypothetical protein
MPSVAADWQIRLPLPVFIGPTSAHLAFIGLQLGLANEFGQSRTKRVPANNLTTAPALRSQA